MAKSKENSPIEAPRPERWSAQQKTEIVLRLLRGEDLGEVSREIQVPAHELEDWRRVFLEGGTQGMKRRSGDPLEKELTRTRAKLGQTMMKLELVEDLLEKRGYGDEVRRLLKRGHE
jgi:transposase-like protein